MVYVAPLEEGVDVQVLASIQEHFDHVVPRPQTYTQEHLRVLFEPLVCGRRHRREQVLFPESAEGQAFCLARFHFVSHLFLQGFDGLAEGDDALRYEVSCIKF